MKTHSRSDENLEDFCDGTLFKSHELFSQKPLALQLIIYYDDVEVCNPLGSYRGVHKLGKLDFVVVVMQTNLLTVQTHLMWLLNHCSASTNIRYYTYNIFPALFYYMLGNLQPKFRSTLRSIRMIAAVTSSNLQHYGYERVLEPFINDANKLSEV